MKERALTADETAAIDQHGLWNLSSFLPKKPDDAHLNAIMQMFQASVDEEYYDPDRWAQFYRPNGMRFDNTADSNNSAATTTVSMPTVSPAGNLNKMVNKAEVDEDQSSPWEEPIKSVQSTNDKPKLQTPDDIIAAIRARQAKK
jgi:hypothetical protein